MLHILGILAEVVYGIGAFWAFARICGKLFDEPLSKEWIWDIIINVTIACMGAAVWPLVWLDYRMRENEKRQAG